MNKNDFDKKCFDFEELISAAIDGELDHDEFSELENHVDNCSECRARYQQMDSVNDLLGEYEQSLAASKAFVETSQRLPLTAKPVVDLSTTESPIIAAASASFDCVDKGALATMTAAPAKARRHQAKQTSANETSSSSNRRRMMFAGGAFAALGLAAMLTTSPSETAEPTVDAAALTQTVHQVTVLNHETKRAQQSQTNTMGFELRALRLAALNSAKDPKQMEAIYAKIDSIQQRLEQLKLKP